MPAAIASGMHALCGCETVVDERIHNMAVCIDLSQAGQWQTWGVAAVGQANYFVYQPGSERLPSGFPYKRSSATGFGGVLLVMGMDPFSLQTMTPLAFDLSCPVEKSPAIRVAVDPESLEAVCPDCHSHYDVIMAGGAPLSGPAATGKRKYGLRRYSCLPTAFGGYLISNSL